MEKKSNLGKSVKKWLGQGKNIEEISALLKKSPEECYSAFQRYMGRTQISKHDNKLLELIKNREKIHLYGETGSGKSYLVRQLSSLLGFDMVVSSPRSEEDLLKDFADTPFIENRFIFVLEGDAYYWRKYGLVKKYIEDSKSCVIIITEKKETPTKNITKHLTQVKKLPPTRSEVLTFLKSYVNNVNHEEIIEDSLEDCYDKDWRKVWRNFRYGKEETAKQKRIIDAKTVAYRIMKGEATLQDFDDCKHPLSFILNWLGYNLHSFYNNKQTLLRNFNIVSYVDANKYNLKKSYLLSLLLEITPMEKKGQLNFPPFKPKKKDESKGVETNYTISLIKQKKVKKRAKKSVSVENLDSYIEDEDDDLGDFMLI